MSATESNVGDSPSKLDTRAGDCVELEYALAENGDGETECTVFPRDCDEEEIVTHWITASEDSFVALSDVR